MARSLVIVESPAKAKTINKYLGRGYNVKASYGHVMDLPKKTIGILLPGENGNKKKKRKTKAKGKAAEKKVPKPIPVTSENIFEPTYEVIPSKLKVISDLQKAARRRRSHLSGGRPGSRGRSHMRPPQGDSEQAEKIHESCRGRRGEARRGKWREWRWRERSREGQARKEGRAGHARRGAENLSRDV